MPLFIVEERAIPFDSKETPLDSWAPVRHESLSLLDAVCAIEFESASEVNSDPFWAYHEYRIRFEPYKERYHSYVEPDKRKPLKWIRGDMSNRILEIWKQYKINIQNMQEKKLEYLKNKGA